MKPVRAIKITLNDLIDSNPANTMFGDWVVPAKATILSGSAGTLVESAEGGLYLVPVGDWFRSDFFGRGLPQVSDFNQLQDLGFTEIKDRLVRNSEPQKEEDGQEIRGEDNVGIEKADEAVAADSSKKKGSKSRSGAV